MNLAVIGAAGRFVRRIPQDVLVSKLLLDLSINLVDRLLLRNLKQAAARFLGDPLGNFLRVGPLLRLGRVSMPPASAMPAAPAAPVSVSVGTFSRSGFALE